MEGAKRDRDPWVLPAVGALAGLVVGAADALAAGLDPGGAAILGLRAALVGLAAGALQEAAARIAGARRGRMAVRIAVLAVAAPWSVWAGLHLSRTATLRDALPPWLALVLPVAALFPVAWIALALHHRSLRRRLPLWAPLLGLAAGGLLLLPARWLSDLHGPLSISCAAAAFLAVELALTWVARRAPRPVVPEIALVAGGLALVSPLLPVSVADAYSATDRSATLGLLVGAGRTAPLPRFDEVAAGDETEADLDARERLAASAVVELPRAAGRSLVLISVDALRADRLGGAGYRRSLTPSIDALARRAVVFERAYAPSPTSSFSIPSLHAGTGMEAALRAGDPLPETLADRLGAAGYTTVGFYPEKIFSAGPELLGPVKRSGFGFGRTVLLTMDARADGETVRRELARASERPLFVWIHLYDPHLPYACHGEPFGSSPEDCYDAEVAHADAEIGRLLPWLEERLDDPVVAVTADHGEAFGEHGRLYHSADLHEEQIRVPLLIAVPGVAPRRVPGPVSITDLPATLLALVAPDGSAAFAGHDLGSVMAGAADPPPITASIRGKRALVSGELKLMCNDWPGGPCALYDLAADPSETRNLIAERPIERARLRRLLERLDRAEIDRLRASLPRPILLGRLGRLEAADGLVALARTAGSPHREEAARTLAMFRKPELAQSLASLHGSDDGRVAAWSCVGSALLDEPCDGDLLAARVGRRDALGRWAAVGLGRLGDARGLERLTDDLETDDPELRAAAALALGALGDPRAVEPLIRLLEVKQTRWAAIEALGALGDARAADPLIRLRRTEPDETNLPRYDRALLSILGP